MKVSELNSYSISIIGSTLIKDNKLDKAKEIVELKEYKVKKVEKSPRIDYINRKFSDRFFPIQKHKESQTLDRYVEDIEKIEQFTAQDIIEKAKRYKK